MGYVLFNLRRKLYSLYGNFIAVFSYVNKPNEDIEIDGVKFVEKLIEKTFYSKENNQLKLKDDIYKLFSILSNILLDNGNYIVDENDIEKLKCLDIG